MVRYGQRGDRLQCYCLPADTCSRLIWRSCPSPLLLVIFSEREPPWIQQQISIATTTLHTTPCTIPLPTGPTSVASCLLHVCSSPVTFPRPAAWSGVKDTPTLKRSDAWHPPSGKQASNDVAGGRDRGAGCGSVINDVSLVIWIYCRMTYAGGPHVSPLGPCNSRCACASWFAEWKDSHVTER
jgi:hypothetical protein